MVHREAAAGPTALVKKTVMTLLCLALGAQCLVGYSTSTCYSICIASCFIRPQLHACTHAIALCESWPTAQPQMAVTAAAASVDLPACTSMLAGPARATAGFSCVVCTSRALELCVVCMAQSLFASRVLLSCLVLQLRYCCCCCCLPCGSGQGSMMQQLLATCPVAHISIDKAAEQHIRIALHRIVEPVHTYQPCCGAFAYIPATGAQRCFFCGDCSSV